MKHGNQSRTQHLTEANATSSHSHAVFQVCVHCKPRTTGILTQVCVCACVCTCTHVSLFVCLFAGQYGEAFPD